MRYSLKDIEAFTGGKMVSSGNLNTCSQVYTDSRTIGSSSGEAIFFAIAGKNKDGHLFIAEAYQKGVRNFVIEDEKHLVFLKKEIIENSGFLVVNNSIETLQKLAIHHRQSFQMPVIGITGSNGKTIIKEWLYQLLYHDKSIHRSPKSYNSQLGVPLSVLGLNENFNLGIFEAGISMKGEMEKLELIIQPDTGIFTNIGTAHQENFSSIEEKISEKLNLFKNSNTLIYRKDYLLLENEILKKQSECFFTKDIRLINWSLSGSADFMVSAIEKSKYDTLLKADFKGKAYSVKIPFTDEASVENIVHCWIYMIINDYSDKEIKERMLHLSPVEMRLELKEGINNCTIINDSYNSDINSLSIALDFLNEQNQHQKKSLILSDILQSGLDEKILYQQLADILKSKGINRLIGVGTAISRHFAIFECEKSFYPSTDTFLENIPAEKFNDESILIKGARIFEFEKLSNALQKKVHTTRLELNLHSLVNNLNIYRSFLKPETKIMAMVKAFSYGSGSFEIANVLQYQQLDYLAVAYADEGVELRKNAITLPIMVMNPDRDSLAVIFNNDLEPEIFSIRLLNEVVAFANVNSGLKSISIHIKVDSGMHRLGFSEDELDELVEVLKNNHVIKVKSIFSHLAASESGDDDKFTRRQLIAFKKSSDKIINALDYRVMRHLLNSSGIVRFPYAQFEMVRLGLGLYGIDSSGIIQEKLEPIGTFRTTISQVREVKKGETAGYGTNTIMKEDTRIAIIGVGYADGFNRALGNGVGTVMVKGVEANVVGNVCMDMTLINLTGIDASEGDEVIIFGRELPVQQMAYKLNTIPYEILTSVSQRVKRVFYKE